MEVFQVDGISDLKVIQPNHYKDERGYFMESYNYQNFSKLGITLQFVQDNLSFSHYGVLRGLHFQIGEYAQAKLVRVVEGKVWDVAVDLRKDSSSYGMYFGIELSGQNHTQLLVPRGFAHGFVTLSKFAILEYKCDNYYHLSAERGIRFDDPTLQIDWPMNRNDIILSDKDRQLPHL